MSKFKNLSKKSKILLVISLVVVACLIFSVGTYFFGIIKLFGKEYEPNRIISSPDGQYELVVREWSCLGGSGADVYIRESEWYNSWKMNEIGTVSADDYYHPFSNGTYYVEWESDKVTICFYQCLPIENANDRSTWRGVLSYEFE